MKKKIPLTCYIFQQFSPYFLRAFIALGLFWFILKSVCQSKFLFAHFQICLYAFVWLVFFCFTKPIYIIQIGFVDSDMFAYLFTTEDFLEQSSKTF